MTKAWYHSKTMWVNILSAVVAGLEAGDVVQLIPAEHQPLFLTALSVANVLLRTVTSSGVSIRRTT